MKRKYVGIGAVIAIFLVAIMISSATAVPLANSTVLESQINATLSKEKKSLSKLIKKITDSYELLKEKPRILEIFKELKERDLDTENVTKLLFLLSGIIILLVYCKLLKNGRFTFRTLLIVDSIAAQWQFIGRKLGYLPSECIESEYPILDRIFEFTFIFLLFREMLIQYFLYRNYRMVIVIDLLFQLYIGFSCLIKYPDIEYPKNHFSDIINKVYADCSINCCI